MDSKPLRALLAAALTVWAFAPIIAVALVLVRRSKAISQLASPAIWLTLTPLWILASVFIMLILLRYRSASPTTRSHVLLGVLCTITIGIPTIMLGALGIVGDPEDLPYQWAQIRSEVSLASPPENALPSMYVMLLDVSDSFIKTTKDNRFACACTVMLRVAETTTYNVFGDGPLVTSRDSCVLRAMAGKLGDPIAGHVADTVRHLDQRRFSELKAACDSTRTNIYDALNTVALQYADCGDYRHVNIIVISDFLHDPLHPDQDAQILKEEDRIRRLTTHLDSLARVSVTAVYPSPETVLTNGHADMSMRKVDFLSCLLSQLHPGKIGSLNMEEFCTWNPYRQTSTLAMCLFKDEQAVEPLYLRYFARPPWKDVPAYLNLAGDIAQKPVFADLLDHDGGRPGATQVRLGGVDGPVLGGRDCLHPVMSEIGLPASTSVTLDRAIYSPRNAEYVLRLVFPKARTAYSIPVVVTSCFSGTASLLMGIFLFGMLFLPLGLAFFMHREMRATGGGGGIQGGPGVPAAAGEPVNHLDEPVAQVLRETLRICKHSEIHAKGQTENGDRVCATIRNGAVVYKGMEKRSQNREH